MNFFSPSFEAGEEKALQAIEEQFKRAEEREAMKAPYKLELAFSHTRSGRQPSCGMIRIWKSGKRLHGGGDDSMAWCGYKDCGKHLEPENMSDGRAFCPACRRAMFMSVEDRQLAVSAAKQAGVSTSELSHRPIAVPLKMFKLPVELLAGLLEQLWRELGGNADLCIKFFRSPIRYKKDDVKVDQILRRARTDRSYAVYTLDRIIKDTVAGASVRDKFLAFLKA